LLKTAGVVDNVRDLMILPAASKIFGSGAKKFASAVAKKLLGSEPSGTKWSDFVTTIFSSKLDLVFAKGSQAKKYVRLSRKMHLVLPRREERTFPPRGCI
jgi:hypothetical protein